MQASASVTSSPVKIATLLLCCFTFLLIPLKISSLGYLPPDDTLRHVAFAVDQRHWNEVLVLNPEIRDEMDSHPGWHSLLRGLHQRLGLSPENLAVFSFCATVACFALAGLILSGSPVAWLLTCGLILLVEEGFFMRLLLGRPFAISIAAMVALLFVWARDRPLELWLEGVLTVSLLTLSVWVHPSVWYMWAAPWFVLLVCRRFRAAAMLSAAVPIALLLATWAAGSWYNIVTYPVIHLWHALGEDPLLGTSLVGEFQPSGGPVLVVIALAGILAVKHFKGYPLQEEFRHVDFCLMLLMWILGLKMIRFWADWGVPAFAVWSCRQFVLLKFDQLPRPRDTLVMTGLVSVALFLGITADVGGRYTHALKSPLLTKPVEDYQNLLPEKDGVLYCTDMTIFYRLYYRLPHGRFRFSTGFEPGMMPPEDLKILRAIQFNDGLLDAYKPWLEKMTEKDRILLFYPRQPEWPGMKFDQFYTMWIGRKLTIAERAEAEKAKSAGGTKSD